MSTLRALKQWISATIKLQPCINHIGTIETVVMLKFIVLKGSDKMKDYQKIVNQLGRIMKVESLELKDKETLYYIRRKYYNKLKDKKLNKQ